MSTICDKCNRPTRTIYPYVREAATIAEAFDPNRILPRSALSPEQNAVIPWGEHPDDNTLGQMCERCFGNDTSSGI
jgi:hypothetical protein